MALLFGFEAPDVRDAIRLQDTIGVECGSETEWIELPKSGRIHSYTTCYFGSEAFLSQTPFHLIMVEFDGVDSLFLARLIGADTEDLYIGMPVVAKFKRLQSFSPTDVYFVPSPDAVKGRK